jgi:hypothetical protein
VTCERPPRVHVPPAPAARPPARMHGATPTPGAAAAPLWCSLPGSESTYDGKQWAEVHRADAPLPRDTLQPPPARWHDAAICQLPSTQHGSHLSATLCCLPVDCCCRIDWGAPVALTRACVQGEEGRGGGAAGVVSDRVPMPLGGLAGAAQSSRTSCKQLTRSCQCALRDGRCHFTGAGHQHATSPTARLPAAATTSPSPVGCLRQHSCILHPRLLLPASHLLSGTLRPHMLPRLHAPCSHVPHDK